MMESFFDVAERTTIRELRKHSTDVLAVICMFSFIWVYPADAEVIGFIETFDGEGMFQTIEGEFDGLDNPDWSFLSTGDGQLEGGGLAFEHIGMSDGTGEESTLQRRVEGAGGFVERVEFRDLDLGTELMDEPASGSLVRVTHVLDPERWVDSRASIALILPQLDPHIPDGEFVLRFRHSLTRVFHTVPIGENVALEIEFDDVLATLNFRYDDDTQDEVAPIEFGPYLYSGGVSELQHTELLISSEGNPNGKANGLLDLWSQQGLSFPGDYDGDDVLTVADVDLLMTQIREGPFADRFDLNDDSALNFDDVRVWVEDLKGTFLGDANLDGEFNSSDLVEVFVNGEYEDNIALNSTWATGDWNADGEFESGDLVAAFVGGGYDIGPRQAVNPVPAPTSFVMLITGLIGIAIRRRIVAH